MYSLSWDSYDEQLVYGSRIDGWGYSTYVGFSADVIELGRRWKLALLALASNLNNADMLMLSGVSYIGNDYVRTVSYSNTAQLNQSRELENTITHLKLVSFSNFKYRLQFTIWLSFDSTWRLKYMITETGWTNTQY